MSQRILLVDDSETVLQMAQIILGSPGFELALARDGVEAIEVAESFRPDLVLLDVLMPGMDGLETCRELRNRESEAVADAYELGCTDSVTRPFLTGELRNKVENCLAGG